MTAKRMRQRKDKILKAFKLLWRAMVEPLEEEEDPQDEPLIQGGK
jgi:hypothetical protein